MGLTYTWLVQPSGQIQCMGKAVPAVSCQQVLSCCRLWYYLCFPEIVFSEDQGEQPAGTSDDNTHGVRSVTECSVPTGMGVTFSVHSGPRFGDSLVRFIRSFLP